MDEKPKRKTWRDSKAGTVGFTLDCILKSGARYTIFNDPFNAKGNSPAVVAQGIVKHLALIYGPDKIEAACQRAIRAARVAHAFKPQPPRRS